MGLFGDTIRDARRPMPAATVRRAVDDGPEVELPDDDVAAPPSGMQTVFRFNQAAAAPPPPGPAEFREASFRPGGAEFQTLPAGDPLPAGKERILPATGVRKTDTSVRGDRRGSNLETGQEVSGSPGKVTAANAVHVPDSPQSEVSLGRSAASSHRETRSTEIPEGSEAPAGPRSKTPWRQEAGRGASSEYPSVGATADQAAGFAARPASATNPGAASPGPAIAAPGAPATPLPMTERRSVVVPAIADSAAPPGRRDGPPPARPASPQAQPSAPAPDASAEPGPRLVIGRIDVVVLAASSPATHGAAPAERGFLSRNYLKRL